MNPLDRDKFKSALDEAHANIQRSPHLRQEWEDAFPEDRNTMLMEMIYNVGFEDGRRAAKAEFARLLAEQPAQPEQEPTNFERHERNVQKFLGTQQPKEPEHEPVAVVNSKYANRIEWKCTLKSLPADGTKLYTTPPQLKPLTDGYYVMQIDRATTNIWPMTEAQAAEIANPTQPKEPEHEPVAWPEPMKQPPLYADEDIAEQSRASCYRTGWNNCLERCKAATTPPQRKLPEAGDGHDLFYEAVRLLDNAIFAQSGDVVRHDLAAHREALDFFNQVFTRLDMTPPPQLKPLVEIVTAVLDHCYGAGAVTDDMIQRATKAVESDMNGSEISA